MGEWKHTAGDWFGDEAEAKGIATTSDLKHHAISAKLDSPASTTVRCIQPKEREHIVSQFELGTRTTSIFSLFIFIKF
jgi:hypothetical protein